MTLLSRPLRAALALGLLMGPLTSLGGTAAPAESTYQRAPDLYHWAAQALSLSDRQRLVQAWHAATECRHVHDDLPLLAELAQAATSIRPNTARAQAARELLSRCKGFVDRGVAATLAFRHRVAARLQALDPQAPGPAQFRALSTQVQLQRVLDDQDWITFTHSGPELLRALQRRHGVQPDSADALVLGLAWVLATCQLSQGCSTQSLDHLVRCAVHDRCDTRPCELGDEVPTALHARIHAKAREMASAFRARDAGYFGLPAPPPR